LLWGGLAAKRWSESKLKELGKLWKRHHPALHPRTASVAACAKTTPIPPNAAMVHSERKE
jgi:hypothetical protein